MLDSDFQQTIKMKCLIIFKGTIWDNTAGTNRLLTIAKGLQNEKIICRIICINPSPVAMSAKGKISNIEYCHLARARESSLSRKISIFIALFKLLNAIKMERERDIVLYQYGESVLLTLSLFFCGKKFGIKIVRELNEYPYLLIRKNKFNKVLLPFYLRISYRFSDAIIVISSALATFYSKFVSRNCIIFKLPMTVDMFRFNTSTNGNLYNYGKYLAYCGTLSENKDGLFDLLEAYSIISPEFPSVKLLIIGAGDEIIKLKIRKILQKKQIAERVILTGEVEKSDIPSLLNNALALLLARPNTLQNMGGFPTKLGEYLATSKPVIVTKVGEIAEYLKDGESAYLAEPNDPNGFALKIKYVLMNYEKALVVGARGRDLAQLEFAYDSQIPKLADFLAKLIGYPRSRRG